MERIRKQKDRDRKGQRVTCTETRNPFEGAATGHGDHDLAEKHLSITGFEKGLLL